jgi:hypothetical protein
MIHHEGTKEHEGSFIKHRNFVLFVLFVFFVVKWNLFRAIEMKPYSGSQRSAVPVRGASLPFIESGRCGLLIGSFQGDGAPS